MGIPVGHWLLIACIVLATAGCVYALGAAFAVRRFDASNVRAVSASPGVSILKPLAGAEAGLLDHLASYCQQAYAGPIQVICGVQSAGDAAIGVVDRLRAARPGQDLELVIDACARGANPKVSNLAGLQRHMRHDVVLVADSDIVVGEDYVATIVAALLQPGVGAVTCLYRGAAGDGIWSRLASMAIDYRFLPDVLVGMALGLARPCFGSTIALRRDTLAAIGGFEAFLDRLADDNAIGEAVRQLGLRVVVPRCVVVHACPERTGRALFAHELRWARTLRAVSPLGYAGLLVTHPLPFAVAVAVLGAGTGVGGSTVTLVALAIGCRLVLQRQVDHTLRVDSGRWWLGPVRDMLSFVIYVASFFVNAVSWRGSRYQVRADGTLVPLARPKP